MIVIADFGASLKHTHHGSSIRAFVNLARTRSDIVVLLPIHSELTAFDLGCEPEEVKYCLLPSSHRSKFRKNVLLNLFPVIFDKLATFASASRQFWILKVLIFISNVRLEATLKSFLLKDPRKEVRLLFPTTCPLAIGFSERFVKKNSDVRNLERVCLRLTNTAENRGSFAGTNNIETLTTNLLLYNNSSIFIGFEMEEYFHSLPELKALAFHSPFPCPNSWTCSDTRSLDKLTFSFLGFPKSIKGITNISEIVTRVNKVCGRKISWIIQITNDENPTWDNLLSQENISLLKGKISSEKMMDSIYRSDYLVLPYDPSHYRRNASAMAYLAAEQLKPVLTLTGSAFANEVEKFSIGLVYPSIDKLIEGIKKIVEGESRINSDDIVRYNTYRNNSNLRFLGLDS